jgi:hypothetical protein
METLDHLNRGRGQRKSKRAVWAKVLCRAFTLRTLFVIAPLLAKIVQLGIELFKVLRH